MCLESMNSGNLIIVEYVEEHPLFLNNPGMASKLINLWRLLEADVAAERAQPTKGKEERSRSGRITRETLASHRIDLEKAHASVPDFEGEGQTIVLYPEDESPFLGNIEPHFRQMALWNNMYKAPLFKHNVSSSAAIYSGGPLAFSVMMVITAAVVRGCLPMHNLCH